MEVRKIPPPRTKNMPSQRACAKEEAVLNVSTISIDWSSRLSLGNRITKLLHTGHCLASMDLVLCDTLLPGPVPPTSNAIVSARESESMIPISERDVVCAD